MLPALVRTFLCYLRQGLCCIPAILSGIPGVFSPELNLMVIFFKAKNVTFFFSVCVPASLQAQAWSIGDISLQRPYCPFLYPFSPCPLFLLVHPLELLRAFPCMNTTGETQSVISHFLLNMNVGHCSFFWESLHFKPHYGMKGFVHHERISSPDKWVLEGIGSWCSWNHTTTSSCSHSWPGWSSQS